MYVPSLSVLMLMWIGASLKTVAKGSLLSNSVDVSDMLG